MFPTKSKPALVIALVLLLCIAAGVLVMWQFTSYRGSAADIQGFWEGTIKVQNSTLRLVVKIDRSAEGQYTATLDSIDQGTQNVRLHDVTLSNRTVRFEMASMQAGFQGDLNQRATEITGQWRQRGTSLPLTLKRTTTPSVIAAPLPADAYKHRQDSPLQGAWKGTLQAGAVPLRIVFKISETSPGKLSGLMDSTDQGARNIPITSVEFAPPTARFTIVSLNGEFEGTLNEEASELDGTWSQSGRDFPLLLKRMDPAEDSSPGESAYAFASDQELQGFWHGTLEAGAARLRLLLKIARATNGTYSATMDSLDQGTKDISAAAVNFNDSNVQVEWSALRAIFHGRLENGKLVGFWQQGPADFPIEFERTNRITSTNLPKPN